MIHLTVFCKKIVQKIAICEKCIEELSEYGTIVSDFYEIICTEYCRRNAVFSMPGYFGRGAPRLHLLEKKGFIVTVDHKRFIFAKPVGYEIKLKDTHVLHEICASRTKH